MSNSLDAQAVKYFKEYLRIPSVQPNCDYEKCVIFLKNYAERLKLAVAVHEVAAKKPVVVISWPGSRPELPSLLLSSHMDVVPVFAEKWTHEPFGAEEDEAGNIYARGAQDMKCVGIQYLEAVHRLILQGYKPKRSVHICFTPDEEIGLLGMGLFVETEAFKKLNVGCALDEGVASPDESVNLYYGQRSSFPVTVTCTGTPGHGSLLHDNTAGEKLSVVIQKFMERRAQDKKKLTDNPNLTPGDVTTINITKLEGGVQTNVVPPELKVMFDCRMSPDTNYEEFEEWVRGVCALAGDGVSYMERRKRVESKITKLDASNPWWTAINTVFTKIGLKVNCLIFPAGNDALHIRKFGIPAFGFSPMNHTPVLLHDHDEFLNRNIFLKGIKIYMKIILALANV